MHGYKEARIVLFFNLGPVEEVVGRVVGVWCGVPQRRQQGRLWFFKKSKK